MVVMYQVIVDLVLVVVRIVDVLLVLVCCGDVLVDDLTLVPVSYTHLTLPTIYSV